MGGIGQFVKTLGAEYMPAYSASTAALHVKVTTGVATAQRLGTLSAIPQIPDERFDATNRRGTTRPPWHLIIQVPAAAANPIYLSWDNNTAPVVGGPGLEINPGGYAKFEHAENLLTPHSRDTYLVNSLSSIQIIAAAATAVLLNYSD